MANPTEAIKSAVCQALLKVDFLASVAGRRIVDVELRERDSMGHAPSNGEVILEALILDDGTRIDLTASAQIGYDDVWARAIKTADGVNG